ncbi:MAG: thioredoxin family protein [Crocinitomicaceae bacterium]|nr:thioredoxin family protein [Crocinitomicaceae bacterium]
MKHLFKIIPLFLFLFLTISVNSQLEYPEDKVSWKFSLKQDGDEATIVAKITMVKHWHIYAANLPKGSFTIPTTIEAEKSKNYKIIGKVIEPKPIFVHDMEADEDLYYHSNTITMKRKIKVLSEEDFTLKGKFGFQTCDDTHCLPPFDTDFELKVKGLKKEKSSNGNSKEKETIDDKTPIPDEETKETQVDESDKNDALFYKEILSSKVNKESHPGPQNLLVFHDLYAGIAHAKKENKPIFLDFTGHTCVNCRKMEEQVWGEPGVIEILKDKVVIISLYVDEKTKLPKEEQKEVIDVRGKKVKLKTAGQKWSWFQANKYKANTQPYYRLLDCNGKDLSNGTADYQNHGSAKKFKAWLESGLNEWEKQKGLIENDVQEKENAENASEPNSKDSTIDVESDEKKEDTSNKSLWTIFLLSFGSGFLALLTPCVFPMIPMTVSFFTKQSKTKAAGIRNAIIYGISIIVIFVTLGTVVTAIFGSDALNALSTNVWFNLIFFALLIIFAISFMGAFEITLPNSWVNKVDRAGDKGGLIGIFFMALALALVSFSCTGPIVGTLLVTSASIGGIAPFIGMFGFSLALALPFTLFAAFPGWMNQLPKSGGWLNTVKVVLGFLELALAFKFLSNADLVIQGHYLERELFLAIWIGIFLVLAFYLFGLFQLPHDSKIERLSVGRALFGTFTLVFVIYLIPGLWGAPLKIISGFPPPMAYSESPLGVGGGGASAASHIEGEDTHPGPQNLPVFHDLQKGMAYAKKVGKPVFLDFTGHACVNCRKMEEQVWGEPGVIEILKNKVVIISLYVDEKTELPKEEQKMITDIRGKKVMLKTVGQKWSDYQAKTYKANTQPYYRMLNSNGKDLPIGSADYQHHGSAAKFKAWLEKGLKKAKK